MAHRFLEYAPWKGDIERRNNGSIIAMESGTAFAYSIDKLQDRGRFFIFPQDVFVLQERYRVFGKFPIAEGLPHQGC